MIKISVKRNLKKKVESVLSQISLLVIDLLPASSEMCMPRESENASAIAITNIPETIASLECVPEFKPIIKPGVAMISDVEPKPNPFRIEIFMKRKMKGCL